MSRIVPTSGPEASRTAAAALVQSLELHTTSDQRRLFLENAVVAPYWHGSVADQNAMLRLANRHATTGVSAAASDNSFNDAGGFPGDWTAGDVLTVDGFSDVANVGTAFTVVSRTTTKLVVSGGTLVDEAAGATVCLTRNGRPGCWPGDKCKRADYGTIWECVSGNGKSLSDWVEVTTDRIGTVKMWKGSLADLPTGYALCDGTGGTSDLRDKFVLGKGASSAIGDTGGAATHEHGLSGGTSTAAVSSVSAGTPAGTVSATFAGTPVAAASTTGDPDLVAADVTAAGVSPVTTAAGTVSATFAGTALGNHSHALSGHTDAASALPPYYVLAFIERVS